MGLFAEGAGRNRNQANAPALPLSFAFAPTNALACSIQNHLVAALPMLERHFPNFTPGYKLIPVLAIFLHS